MRLSVLRRAAGALAALSSAALLLAGCTSADSPDRRPGATASSAKPRSAPLWPERPRTVVAVGDSITRGFDACSLLRDCPEVSWVTGSDSRVKSLASRLLLERADRAGSADNARNAVPGSWNLARSGARVDDLPAQVRRAAGHRPDVLVVLIGANDACRSRLSAMTSVADFRADFTAALAVLREASPQTRVLVGSVPDLEQLWRVGRGSRMARQVWRLGVCPTMLGDPESNDRADRDRRAAVSRRVDAYNTVLKESCAAYRGCVWDGGAVHAYRFTRAQLSPWDWFHPSVEGQAELAAVVYRAAFGGASRGW